MKVFVDMLIAALYAMIFQNLVLTAGFGISESIKIAKRPKYLLTCVLSVGFFSIITSVLCAAVEKIKLFSSLNVAFRYFIYVLILSIIYMICGLVLVKVFNANKKFMNSFSMCAYNSLIICIPIINFKANYSFVQCLGTGIGAALAFVISVILINAGIRFVNNNSYIPKVFRGTPAILLYIAILSLALSCFSGEALFV